MKAGIIADTHDNVPKIEQACEIFNNEDVTIVIHAGDYIAPFSLRPLNEVLTCDYTGVFGNNDGEQLGLQRSADGRIHPSPMELVIEDWKILVAHNLPIVEAVASGGRYRLVVYGHTHRPEVKKVNDTLVVNPGECGGWLYGNCTIAIANLEDLTAEIRDL